MDSIDEYWAKEYQRRLFALRVEVLRSLPEFHELILVSTSPGVEIKLGEPLPDRCKVLMRIPEATQ